MARRATPAALQGQIVYFELEKGATVDDLAKKVLTGLKPGFFGSITFEFRNGQARKAVVSESVIADDILVQKEAAIFNHAIRFIKPLPPKP
jgi:hypothetical protein